jgi:predicted small metal-binding protein
LSGSDITVRVFEYAIQKALENQRIDGKKDKKVLYLPRSLVIHFEKNSRIPEQYELEIVFPNGESHEYTVDIMKYWEYTDKKLMDKKLYNLLPLQVFLLRTELKKVMKEGDRQNGKLAKSRAKEISDKIFVLITELHEEQKINSDDYNKIITGLTEIMRHLDVKYNLKLRGEIEVIKTIADKNILKRANQAEQALQKEKEKNIEIMKKLLLKNISMEEIMDYGFTKQEIQDVQKTLQK